MIWVIITGVAFMPIIRIISYRAYLFFGNAYAKDDANATLLGFACSYFVSVLLHKLICGA